MDEEQKIVIFKKVNTKWYLIAMAKIVKGKVCKMNYNEKEKYDELMELQQSEEVEVVDDINFDTFELKEYNELLKNITFKNDDDFKLRVVPPIVNKVNRDCVINNFNEVCNSIDLRPDDETVVNYINLLFGFLKNEFSCSCDLISDNKLSMRGKFNNTAVSKVVVKFINKYLTCFSCQSPRTYLFRSNRMLKRQCLTCNSISNVNL